MDEYSSQILVAMHKANQRVIEDIKVICINFNIYRGHLHTLSAINYLAQRGLIFPVPMRGWSLSREGQWYAETFGPTIYTTMRSQNT